ncbi:MAG: LemA family protein [Ferruginibacter sp.]|nr:LemA family protein [Ferruginibacter sp.]
MANIARKKYGLVALIVLALLAIFIVVTRNGFVQKEENVTKTWNYVQSDYQRRLDLIPNLVNAVKGSADYEKNTLIKVVEERAKKASLTISGNNPTSEEYKKIEAANGDLVNSANQLIGVIEKYPDLKTANSFVRLQDQLIGTERRIKFSRNDFNKAIQEYNTSVRSFPSSLVASIFGFKVKDGFVADAGADKAPEITFTK